LKRLSALTLVMGLCGCADGPESLGFDLLAYSPEQVFEYQGDLVPDLELGWGESDGGGWAPKASMNKKGRVYMQTKGPRAVLELTTGVPVDRDLEIEAGTLGPIKEAMNEVAVLLNGIELGRIAPNSTMTVHRIETPSQAWLRGRNELVLESFPVSPDRPKMIPPLKVYSVRHGGERRVELDPSERTSTLRPGTGLRYLVEVRERTRLLLKAGSTGPGELHFEFAAWDPETGTSADLKEQGQLVSLDRARDFERYIRLPSPGHRVLQVDLLWKAAADESIEIRSLRPEPEGNETTVELPPIVLISIDTLGARNMSLYGYARKTTPRLEELARESVVFDHCISNAPWTLPSYLALFSGLFPKSHFEPNPGPGHRIWDRWSMAESRWSMAEMLRSLGYSTGSFAASPWISHQYHLDQGFDTFQGVPSYARGFEQVAEAGLEWLESVDPSRPYFLFLQSLDPHGPYHPPDTTRGTFSEKLSPEQARMEPAGLTIFCYGGIHESVALGLVSEEELPALMDVERLQADYDETILATDQRVHSFLETLRAEGRYDDALIIFTADHGESFDHGYYGHSGVLYEEVIHVPLMIKFPRGEHGGTRISTTVQLTDIYPTLCSILFGSDDRSYFHGRSLLPLLSGDVASHETVFSEGGLVDQRTVKRGEWKLIELHPGRFSSPDALLTHPRTPRDWLAENFPTVLENPLTPELAARLREQESFNRKIAELRRVMQGPFYELYNLRDDRAEELDLSAEHPDVVAELASTLQARTTLRNEAKANEKKAGSRKVELDEADLEELRRLGYVGD